MARGKCQESQVHVQAKPGQAGETMSRWPAKRRARFIGGYQPIITMKQLMKMHKKALKEQKHCKILLDMITKPRT